MTRSIILICISFLLLYGTASSCKKISAEETSKMDPTVQKEAKVATRQMLSLWLSEGIEGVQFLRTSKWKIDEQVFLNSSKDKGYLLLLNQAKDPLATVDCTGPVCKQGRRKRKHLPGIIAQSGNSRKNGKRKFCCYYAGAACYGRRKGNWPAI